MKQRTLILFVIMCIFLVSCSAKQTEDDLPDEVLSLVETYMDACKISADEAIQYIHFESEFTRETYLISGVKLLDYKVNKTEKINDNLYALTVLVKTTATGDDFLRVYNFAALIDEKWFYINGVGNIPLNLKDDFDEEKYSYTHE